MEVLEKEITEVQTDFVQLYKTTFPKVARYVGGKGGTLAEAKDVFQDAVVVYFEKINSEVPFLKKGDMEYIVGIAKKLWINKYREKNRLQPLEESYNTYFQKDESTVNTSLLLRYVEKTGRKCMDLLQAFYYRKLPMKDIAGRFGFSGERSATVQKYKCIEKVRDTIKAKSLSYEDFFE
ncbi:MAG TPA: sigma-70 family RNA polymerase sigma factor [Cytophagales bacterium]|nr:sigma-70 family RNA polymerase sigma factor [Cytophagales bacterium]